MCRCINKRNESQVLKKKKEFPIQLYKLLLNKQVVLLLQKTQSTVCLLDSVSGIVMLMRALYRQQRKFWKGHMQISEHPMKKTSCR